MKQVSAGRLRAYLVEEKWPKFEDVVSLWVLRGALASSHANTEETYVERIYSLVELVYADTFRGLAPIIAVLPHDLGLLEVELPCAEKSACISHV